LGRGHYHWPALSRQQACDKKGRKGGSGLTLLRRRLTIVRPPRL
jgi:hypothetical protein